MNTPKCAICGGCLLLKNYSGTYTWFCMGSQSHSSNISKDNFLEHKFIWDKLTKEEKDRYVWMASRGIV